MIAAVVWFVVVSLIALWSLTAWALHALAVWTVSSAGALSGVASGAATVRLPEWLSAWVPPGFAASMTEWFKGLAPMVDGLLQAAPALAGGLTIAAWVVWAIGSAALVLCGAVVHGLITLWRRRGDGAAPTGGRALAAG